MKPTRRRSPQWIREQHDRALHALALRLRAVSYRQDLTAKQEWLWDAVISELEYRRRNAPRPLWACSCELCVPPFPD